MPPRRMEPAGGDPLGQRLKSIPGDVLSIWSRDDLLAPALSSLAALLARCGGVASSQSDFTSDSLAMGTLTALLNGRHCAIRGELHYAM
jgi:hypothetical protein